MATKYTKWPYNIPTFSILRPSKIYPNRDFWFENIPSGNPGTNCSRPTRLHYSDNFCLALNYVGHVLVSKSRIWNQCDQMGLWKNRNKM
jgi:hypothetical protein